MYPGLIMKVVREMSPEALAQLDARAMVHGLTLAQLIQQRADELKTSIELKVLKLEKAKWKLEKLVWI